MQCGALEGSTAGSTAFPNASVGPTPSKNVTSRSAICTISEVDELPQQTQFEINRTYCKNDHCILGAGRRGLVIKIEESLSRCQADGSPRLPLGNGLGGQVGGGYGKTGISMANITTFSSSNVSSSPLLPLSTSRAPLRTPQRTVLLGSDRRATAHLGGQGEKV